MDVCIATKRNRKEKEAEEEKPSKRQDVKEKGESSKAQRRRKRHLGVQDFSLSQDQKSYSIVKDMGTQRASITYGQLVALAPAMRRELRSGINA